MNRPTKTPLGGGGEGVSSFVQCWGCSARLQPPPLFGDDDDKNDGEKSNLPRKLAPKFLCGHCGAMNSSLESSPAAFFARGGKGGRGGCKGKGVKEFCLVLPARCLARTMGRILIPTVLCLVYYLVSKTYEVSIPKLTTEREKRVLNVEGEMMERTTNSNMMDLAVRFGLRCLLMFACANIYWNYAVSILSRPKSIRQLREDGEGSMSGSESDEEDVESGSRRNTSDRNSNRNGIMPVPWCQQQRQNLENETETDIENGTETTERHPTTIVPRDSFRNCAYCIKCDDVKPFGTSHCSTCNKCIVDLDHHCPFLQNCVGKHNVRAFTCFCLWCSLGCALAFTVAILLPFTSQRATFMKPYERVMSGTDKYSNFGKNTYEHIGHFPTSTGALIQYCTFALKYVSACEDTWIGTWCIVVLATATITPLTFGLFYQTYMAVKRGEFYVASLKAKREREERGGSPESMARDASGLSKHVEEARVKAVFERTKGEHWVFWFLFPRLSRTGRLGRRRGDAQKVQ